MGRRMTMVALAMLAGLAFGAAGCSARTTAGGATTPSTSAAPAPSATPSPTPNAAADLAASTGALATVPYKVTFKKTATDDNTTVTFVVDPTAKSASATAVTELDGKPAKIEVLLIATDRYVRFTGIPVPGVNGTKWNHIDTTKATTKGAFSLEGLSDPIGGAAFSKALVSVQQSAPHQYRGTFDLSKLPESSALAESGVDAIGAQAKSLPFEAAVDEQGRIARLTFSVPAYGATAAASCDVAFADYGVPANLARPPGGQVTEATAAMYGFLNA